jgi:hypothetical protein
MDKQVKIQILVLLLGVLIGAGGYLANSLILYNNSLLKEKTDIAEGLYLDVSSLEKPLAIADQDLQTPGENDDDFVFIQSNPLYPDNGLYYSYQRDIPKLDRKIAQDTFAFYNHLVAAERDRGLIYEIQRQGDLRNLTPAEIRRQKVLTQNVADEVNKTVSLLPPLKQDLDAASSARGQLPIIE